MRSGSICTACPIIAWSTCRSDSSPARCDISLLIPDTALASPMESRMLLRMSSSSRVAAMRSRYSALAFATSAGRSASATFSTTFELAVASTVAAPMAVSVFLALRRLTFMSLSLRG
jgi:hypothetical protein